VPLLERQSVKLVGGVEDAVGQHLVNLEIRLQLVLVQVVALLSDLLRVIVPVSGRRQEIGALRARKCDDVVPLLLLLRRSWRSEAVEEVERRLAVLGHLIVERVVGPIVIPE
jgi:hypothetical protein